MPFNTPCLTTIWTVKVTLAVINWRLQVQVWLPIQVLPSLMTLLILPTPLATLGRQVDAGLTKKSPFSTILRQTALSICWEASTWRKLNLTKHVRWSNQRMIHNATTSGAMYIYLILLIVFYLTDLRAVQKLCGIYKAIFLWDKKSSSRWHDIYSINAQTVSEQQVLDEWLRTPEVS